MREECLFFYVISARDLAGERDKVIEANKKSLKERLQIKNPLIRKASDECHKHFSNQLLIDFSTFRSKGVIDFESLRKDIAVSIEKHEEKLLNTWHQSVISVMSDEVKLRGPESRMFFNCLNALMSNQICNFLHRTIDAVVDLFRIDNKSKLPILKVELVLEDNKMQFYPTYNDLEELVLHFVDVISKSMQKVQTVNSYMASTTTEYVRVILADDIIKGAKTELKASCQRNFEEPQACLQWYIDQYDYLVNGTAQAEIDKFMSEEHEFEEYTKLIESYRDLSYKIMVLPPTEYYDLIRLDCEDLKRGLVAAARDLANQLLEKIVNDHRQENESICAEFSTIKDRALKVPETSEELVDMVNFVETARSMGMLKLNERIKLVTERLQYLLDAYGFTKGDIDLNSEVLLWPRKISPVFDENDLITEKAKENGERILSEKREKVMIELAKLRTRADEFNDYGESEMMAQYVQDVRAVQTRLAEAQKQIEWVNKEEGLYKFGLSNFPEVDEINTAVDPFYRLFSVVFKWQRAEKKWIDGSFTDLNAEFIESEVDDYWRELYKIQKIFNQKYDSFSFPFFLILIFFSPDTIPVFFFGE